MPTNSPGSTARTPDTQQMSYLRKTVNFNDAGLDVGLPFGNPLPAGAQIETTSIDIETAFNAATTNDLTIGTVGAAYNNIVTTAQSVAGSQGVKRSLAPTIRTDQITADTVVYVKYAQTGTAATTGKATITISFSIPNDQ